MKRILLLILCLLFLSLSQNAFAFLINADATGHDSYTVNNFWGFSFVRGSGYIRSISFDLAPIKNRYGHFDLSGEYNEEGGTHTHGEEEEPHADDEEDGPNANNQDEDAEPPFRIVSRAGGAIGANITHQGANSSGLENKQYRKLTLNFSSGSCGAGCGVRFSADSDPGTLDGADHAGTIFSGEFEDGRKFRGVLRANTDSSVSQASVSVVPLPAAAWLFLSALGLGGGLASMRAKQNSASLCANPAATTHT